MLLLRLDGKPEKERDFFNLKNRVLLHGTNAKA